MKSSLRKKILHVIGKMLVFYTFEKVAMYDVEKYFYSNNMVEVIANGKHRNRFQWKVIDGELHINPGRDGEWNRAMRLERDAYQKFLCDIICEASDA